MTWPVADYTVNLAIWAVIWTSLLGWQAVTLALRPRLPSLGDLVFALQRTRLFRVLLFAGWAWLGWHVFIRGGW